MLIAHKWNELWCLVLAGGIVNDSVDIGILVGQIEGLIHSTWWRFLSVFQRISATCVNIELGKQSAVVEHILQ